MAIATGQGPRRRTQAERRATTRAALLDATVACLAEDGYANTTTRRIAERAGVTPGALQHHFATKTELVADAVAWSSKRLLDELTGDGLPTADSPRALTEELLDRIWAAHKGPLVAAATELNLAARHEPLLRERMAAVQDTVEGLMRSAGVALLPEYARQPGYAPLLRTVLATLRGLAFAGYASEADRDAAWPATRAHLLRLLSDDDIWTEVQR